MHWYNYYYIRPVYVKVFNIRFVVIIMGFNISKRGEFGVYLYALYKRRFSGSIAIITKTNTHTLFLRDGKPIYIKERKTTMPLGRVFVELGMIDSRAYDESLMEMVKTGERQGEILLRKGLITKEQMRQAIVAQFYKKSLKFFDISEGEVKIEENAPLPESGSENVENISTLKLLYNGIKSLNKEHINKLLPINTNTTITRKDELDITLFSLPINAEETTLIENINKATPYTQLLSLKIASDTEISQLVYFLFLLELVEIATLDISDTATDTEEGVIKLSGIYKPDFQKEEDVSEEKTTIAPVCSEEDIRWIDDLYSKYQTMDYFEFFGIETSSSKEEINRAYQDLLKRLNTAKNSVNIEEETSIKIDQLTYFAEEAYNTLTSEKSRNEYQSVINTYYQKSNLDEGRAELEFIKGELLLQKRDFAGSFESFKQSIELGGQKPEYVASYGISLYLNPQEPQRSRETLGKLYIKRALSQNPRCFIAHIYWLLISCLEGNKKERESIINNIKNLFSGNDRVNSILSDIEKFYNKKPATGEIRQALREENRDNRVDQIINIFFARK